MVLACFLLMDIAKVILEFIKKKLNISKIKMNFDYKFLVEQTQNKFQPPYTVCFHESDFEDKKNVNYFKNKGGMLFQL